MGRIVGLLSWYHERPSWLSGCITSYAEAGITHLVAIDGAYHLYPGAHRHSNTLEHDAVLETARAAGLHTTIVVPDQPYHGNEIEKRNLLFRYADAITHPSHDWLVVMDADELVTRAYTGWDTKLAQSGMHAADVTMWERKTLDTPGEAAAARQFTYDPRTAIPLRKIFRAFHGIQVKGNHYTYLAPGLDRPLWGQRSLVPGLDLTTDFVVEHRTEHRSLNRKGDARHYYSRRDQAQIEGSSHNTLLDEHERPTPTTWAPASEDTP